MSRNIREGLYIGCFAGKHYRSGNARFYCNVKGRVGIGGWYL